MPRSSKKLRHNETEQNKTNKKLSFQIHAHLLIFSIFFSKSTGQTPVAEPPYSAKLAKIVQNNFLKNFIQESDHQVKILKHSYALTCYPGSKLIKKNAGAADTWQFFIYTFLQPFTHPPTLPPMLMPVSFQGLCINSDIIW